MKDYDEFEGVPVKLHKKFKVTNKYKEYGRTKSIVIQTIYLIAAILWLLLVFYLNLYQVCGYGVLILIIPLVVFGIAYTNSNRLTIETEEDMFKANFLSLGLLIMIPLLSWLSKEYQGERDKFVCVIIIALIMTMLSLIDVWVRKRWISAVKHIKSIFQTLALTLVIYALYIFYAGRHKDELF